MKVQCSCGSKHEFDITPEMADRPVRFICPSCGLDASEFVDGLIRQELGQIGHRLGEPVVIQPSTLTEPRSAPPQRVTTEPPLPVRISPAVPQAQTAPEAVAAPPCLKHPGQFAFEKCRMCGKPICPKCMELFGFVCSPLCKAKAEAHGISIPVFAGQRDVVEARRWRKIVWAASGVGGIVVLVLGAWFWYAWFGSLPRTAFALRFPDPAWSGQSVVCGKDRDQIIYLHGTLLARHDMKANKPIWSANLLDQAAIDEAIGVETKSTKKLIDKANNEGWENVPKMPSAEKLAREMAKDQAASLGLHVRGQHVWVSSPGKLTEYAWDTGKPLKDLKTKAGFGGLLSRGDEVLVVDQEGSKPQVTHINLATGETKTESLGAPELALAAATTNTGKQAPATRTATGGAGLPTRAGQDVGKPMDPAKVAEQAQNLPYAAKLALPATLANTMTQERTLAELDEKGRPKETGASTAGSSFNLVATKDGFVEFGVKLLEQKLVSRSAMKPSSGKSVLEGNVTVGKSEELAGEFLNEIQRSRGGDVVQDDLSRYQVTVRKPGLDQAWTGEVVGPPRLFPLDTINVVAGNSLVIVLDKENKKLWQSSLTYNVRDLAALDEETALYGQGPCVEHKGMLYVIDDGVLTAFEAANGNVKWRLPSIGIAGLFFGDKDFMYVNATTASPDSIKYSRQINLSQKVTSVVIKLDSNTGKVIWNTDPGGMISYVSGKNIFAVASYQPDESEDENPYRVETGFEKPPFLRIRKLSPRNGHEVWEHFQQRAPLYVAFEGNTIRLVFKKEVQVLKFLSW